MKIKKYELALTWFQKPHLWDWGITDVDHGYRIDLGPLQIEFTKEIAE